MRRAVQDANIHPRKEGCAAKPLHRAGPAVRGPQTGSSAPGTLGSGLGVSSGGSRLQHCRGVEQRGEQAGFAGSRLSPPLLLCQFLPKSLRGLLGSPGVPVARGTEWPRVPVRDWGSLIPFFPPFWLHSLVQKCSEWGRGSVPDLTVLGTLAVPKASETKTFLRLHLEQEKVFPLGFYSSRKMGFYFCCLRQKILLGADYPRRCRAGGCASDVPGGLGSALLSVPWGLWMPMLVSTKEERRFWCP